MLVRNIGLLVRKIFLIVGKIVLIIRKIVLLFSAATRPHLPPCAMLAADTSEHVLVIQSMSTATQGLMVS